MDIISSIILGLVQGLTEFLPISSSGHLILAREVLGIETENTLAFDAVLQLATALAVFVYFAKDFIHLIKASISFVLGKSIDKKTKTLLGALIIGTLPAIALGLLLQDYMATVFRNAEFVVITLLAGSALFYFAEKVAKQNSDVTVKKGLWIGLFQSLALFPGMSRSGSTIAGGLILGLTRSEAARFSFLLSFPIIFGSGIVKLLELSGEGFAGGGASLFISAVVAFISGITVIHYLLKYLRNNTLAVFIWYRVILALIVLLVIV